MPALSRTPCYTGAHPTAILPHRLITSVTAPRPLLRNNASLVTFSRRSSFLAPRLGRGRTAATVVAASSDNLVPVRFSLVRRVGFGKQHRIVGSHPSLGKWEVGNGAEMTWTPGDRWVSEVSVPPGTTMEFKVVEREADGDTVGWEPNCNHAIIVPEGNTGSIAVDIKWGSGVEVQHGVLSSPSMPMLTAGSVDFSDSEQQQQQPAYVSDEDLLRVDRPASRGEWSGKKITFMRSNEHSTDRQGVWNTEGLQGAALQLVNGDKEAPSWLRKLEVAKAMLVDNAAQWRPDLDALSHTFVYLTWVATGALPCAEGGGHRRPNHHADLGRLTFRSLEWVGGERAGTADALLARRLQTRLPSFAAEFTQSVPLTRIRDIAHRGDIPHDLKQEIKHTIQNKLHRNAGPEDLEATEALLAKVTANPGQYPDAFISEMRTFLLELRDFFNAGGLAEALTAIRPTLDDSGARLVDHFLANKGKLDAAGGSADDNLVMDVLHGVTSVRALLAAGLSSGLRNDAPDRALAMRQRWRLAEIRAEDYAFVLLSRFINTLEQRGGPSALAAGNDGTWGLPLGALVISLRHIGLCGFQPAECMALEREVDTWQRLGGLTHPEEALRLRATLQRAQRLADAYCTVLLNTLSGPSAALGAALGVDPENSSVFAEAEIRANVVFQLSKLAMLLQRATTEVAQTTPWDVIMAGTAEGVLIEVESLDPGCLDAAGGAEAIVIVKSATGDEEVGSLGPRLRGVILRHHMPHLSHLGVRARQEQVPFVACDDAAEMESVLGPLMGRRVTMVSQVDGVTFEKAHHSHSSNGSEPQMPSASSSSQNGSVSASDLSASFDSAAAPGPVEKVAKLTFVPLEHATPESCGSKAAGCGALLALARECSEALGTSGRADGAPLLEAPHGVVLPFGCLEAALRADGKAEALETAAAAAHAAALAGASVAELDALCAAAASVAASARVPQSSLVTLGSIFDPGSTVIVRSSANVEDLEGMSGAGLYESIPNVDPKDPAALQAAIAGVWSSLHSRRAALARAAAGVPPSAVDMAVVIQRQLAPELSFVLHTMHPLTRDPASLAAEVAPGMGEILAAGTKGSAWRLEVDREAGSVKTLAFCNFSEALMPLGMCPTLSMAIDDDVLSSSSSASSVGGSVTSTEDESAAAKTLSAAVAAMQASPMRVAPCVVDYSQQELSCSVEARSSLGRRLAAVGRLLESEFGGAQDVEGCMMDGHLFVVQTRPQP